MSARYRVGDLVRIAPDALVEDTRVHAVIEVVRHKGAYCYRISRCPCDSDLAPFYWYERLLVGVLD